MSSIAESRDLDDYTLLDVAAASNVCALTFKHPSKRTDFNRLTREGLPGEPRGCGSAIPGLRFLHDKVEEEIDQLEEL